MVCSHCVLRIRYDQELSRLIWLSLGTRLYFDKNLCIQQETQYHDNDHLSESSSLIEVYYDDSSVQHLHYPLRRLF